MNCFGKSFKRLTFETNLNAYLLKNNFKILIFSISLIIVFNSCNSIKYVGENDYLLKSNTLYVNDKKIVDEEITDYIIQRPNQLVLGVPFPLYFYNVGNKNFETDFDTWKNNNPNWYNFTTKVFSEKQARGLRNFKYQTHQWWLKNGEPPVILDLKKAAETVENLEQHYFNEGYFDAKVGFEKQLHKNKKASISYHVTTGKPFIIDSINTKIQSVVLDSIYTLSKANSVLKKGDQFKYQNFENERNRLSELFRNSGVFRFNKNAITYEADTTIHKHKASIDIVINDSIASVPFTIQKIRNIDVYTDFSFNKRDFTVNDSITLNGYTFHAFDKIKYTSGSGCIVEIVEDIKKNHPKKSKMLKGKKIFEK